MEAQISACRKKLMQMKLEGFSKEQQKPLLNLIEHYVTLKDKLLCLQKRNPTAN